MERRTILILTAILATLAIAAGVVMVTKKPSLHGSVIDPPAPAAEINLTDSNGQPFSLSSQRGKVVLLYFGFTHCTDECPIVMAKFKQAFELLGSQASQVQVLMVTTDPTNDTPAQMKNYVTAFNPSFIGLTGTPQELQKAYNDYGVTVLDTGETHSALVYLIDPQGNLRLTYPGPNMIPQELAGEVQAVLKGYRCLEAWF